MRTVRPAARPLLFCLFLVAASAAVAGQASYAAQTPKAGISIGPPSSPLTVKFTAQASGFASAVTSFKWTFGDGTSKTTAVNVVRHTYPSGSTFRVSVIETDTQDQSATATGTLELFKCPAGSPQCSAVLQTPGRVQILSAAGPISPTAPASLDLFTDPFRFPDCDSLIQPAAALTDSGFTGNLTVTLAYQTSHPNQVRTTCFSSEVAFKDAAGMVVHSGPLPMCQAAAPMPPCVQSVNVLGTHVTKVLLVPPGDPRVGAP